MRKAARHKIGRYVGIGISATFVTAGIVALRHMLETPQPLKSQLPGESLLYVWRRRSIFYKVLGKADAPPIVLLHTLNIGTSSHEMQYIMEPLAQTYRVYALDLLGFGLSDRPGIEYSADTYTELCQDFLREVVKRPATLLASGLSCNYAVSVAASTPELCTGLVLISPLALYGDPEQPHILRDLAEIPLFKALIYPLLSTRLAFAWTHTRASSQTDFAQFYANTHQLGAEHAAMALLAGKLVKDITWQFETLSQPILLIWGTRALEDQRNIASLHHTSQLRKARQVELIQEAGLVVQEEQPESVVAILRRWQAESHIPSPTRAENHAQRLSAPEQTKSIIPEPATSPEKMPPARQPTETPQPVQERVPTTEDISPVAGAQAPGPDKSSEHTKEARQASQPPAIMAYCVRCKKKTRMLNASAFTMKNGRPAIRGTCAICGSGINRIGRLGETR